ncbi:MAG: glycosyltransferase family 4 protein [Dehalogenimonas sp.]
MPAKQITKIGLLSFFGRSTQGETLLHRLVTLLSTIDPFLYVVAPDLDQGDFPKISIQPIRYQIGTNSLTQLWNQLKMQLQMSVAVIKSSGKTDVWLLYGGDILILPMVFAKLMRKPAWLILAGNLESEIKLKKNPLNILQRASRYACLHSANRIVLYSSLLIEEWNLRRFDRKIAITDVHYVNTTKFVPVKPFSEREFDIGFVGRLSPEKGIMNFLRSLPFVIQRGVNIKVLIVGGGPLEQAVVDWIESNQLGACVIFRRKVPHESIPGILNEMKICLLPSYTEGMPNVVLESMACGTPVVATPVGAIPDVVRHHDTGFIIKDNSPESIAQGINDALASEELARISIKAREQILNSFTFECAQSRLKKLLGWSRDR